MMMPRFVVWMLPTALIVFGTETVFAQDFPNRLIRIVVASPGGGSDFMARRVAQGISGPLGQTVMVDYRGAGLLSAENVIKSPPDGYTLYVTGSTLWVVPLLRKVPYDVEKDFSPVTLTDQSPGVLAVHPSLPIKSVKELIALAKARPGELTYSSSQAGGSGHLAGEAFKYMASVNILWIPFKAAAMSVTSLVSGEVHLTINDAIVIMPHVKGGRLKGVAVTTLRPSALVPGLPTAAASGLPDYEAVGRTGIWAPAKTPPAIINRLNQDIVRFLNRPDVKESFLDAGTEVVSSTPEEFAALIRSEVARTAKLIKVAGIKVD